MLNSKNPKDFLNSFKKITTKLITVTIKSNSPYYPNKKLYEIAKLNEFNVETAQNIRHAIRKLLLNESPGQILICGSFYMYKEVSKLLMEILDKRDEAKKYMESYKKLVKYELLYSRKTNGIFK